MGSVATNEQVARDHAKNLEDLKQALDLVQVAQRSIEMACRHVFDIPKFAVPWQRLCTLADAVGHEFDRLEQNRAAMAMQAAGKGRVR